MVLSGEVGEAGSTLLGRKENNLKICYILHTLELPNNYKKVKTITNNFLPKELVQELPGFMILLMITYEFRTKTISQVKATAVRNKMEASF